MSSSLFFRRVGDGRGGYRAKVNGLVGEEPAGGGGGDEG